MKKLLVVGGAGYIGSQTVKALTEAQYIPIVYDNLSSGNKEAVLNSKLIIGELADKKLLSRVIKDKGIEAVLHFAGKIEAEESVRKPQEYLQNNCLDGLSLILAMLENKVNKLIFSSTAAVYGESKTIPITEDSSTKPNNPYGLSKLLFEKVLEYYGQQAGLKYISLRYFNAAGADREGQIGDDHASKTHLITSAILTALGQREKLFLYGTDYPTDDGTCVRDYIHVEDLAVAHVQAVDFLFSNNQSEIINLGSESGYSNKQVIEMVKKVSGIDFTVEESARREGDPVVLIASSKKAREVLGWQPKYSDLQTIIETAYSWHKSHPNGYRQL